jgi:hypothetical protein
VAAADVYLKAAGNADGAHRSELQRLAADQLLRVGHIEDGLAVLDGIAREFGVWLPANRWHTLLSIVWQRVCGAFDLVGVARRASSDEAVRRLMLLDVYWSFFVGLSNFDPIRAMDFQLRHRRLAVRVADRPRTAMALAAEAAARAASSGRDSPAIRALIARARGLCEESDAPESRGFIAIMEALCACVVGDWRHCLRLAVDAEHFLSEKCSGVAWERATSIQLQSAAAFHLGNWGSMSEHAQRFPRHLQEAEALGDFHAMVTSIPGGTVPFLSADQPGLAERFIRDTIAVLPGDRFLMPNVWVFTLQVYTALYQGQGEAAWTLVNEQWPSLSRSLFLRIEYVAIVTLDVRARAAIAAAAGTTGTTNRHVNEALRTAKKLARRHSRWACATALMIQACVASVKGQREAAVDLLERAETAFRLADMSQCVAACQYRRGGLVGGETGAGLIADAEAWTRAQGIANGARIFDMLAPGRWEHVGSPSATV